MHAHAQEFVIRNRHTAAKRMRGINEEGRRVDERNGKRGGLAGGAGDREKKVKGIVQDEC